jgi:hypothetical protein
MIPAARRALCAGSPVVKNFSGRKSRSFVVVDGARDTNVQNAVMARPSGPREARPTDRPVRAIHVFSFFEPTQTKKNVDGPHKAGHDELKTGPAYGAATGRSRGRANNRKLPRFFVTRRGAPLGVLLIWRPAAAGL